MGRVSLDTLLQRSEKNMGSGMDAIVKKSALEVIRRAYKEGINAQISHGMRTYEQQNALYAQGRTKSGSIVTNARGGYSNHNFGLAVDYFLTNEDGTKAIWSVNSHWQRVAAIAKSLGFVWGGDWRSFRDYPHLEMTGGFTTAQLRAGKRPTLTDRTGTKPVAPSKPVSQPASSGGSSWVRGAQEWGNSRDYPDKANFKELDEDGLTGPLTFDAFLRIYQYFVKTSIDGVWGPKSRAAAAVQNIDDHTPGWTRLLQATLCLYGYKLKVDGAFGPLTDEALRSFQRSRGIKEDGTTGPVTYTEMFKAA
ncbi:M15 family metallopeptidase [Terribacillus saccharophilus]|uniref:M15 family metallopeptidase n=1 Tax=Terribacillus saccharophilus TaxID=361277 RepID=UPI002DC240BC|nr:M15 family metallopeptidase [Terribacillus saccharophilus]MEC0288795.1 M15 family metallopeptidase [Terribacillus saccharophilus]